jgi:hypothetical protein
MRAIFLFLTISVFAFAEEPVVKPPDIRLILGLDNIKHNAKGQLTVQNGAMQFKAGKVESDVPTSSITDIFVGNETTQGGGTAGKVVKTAAIAAPFGSGKVLTLLLRTKFDILTVVYHGADGGVHGAIFALPKGFADPTRAKLVAAGAHSSAPQTELKERPKP